MKPLNIYWLVALGASLILPLLSHFYYGGNLGLSLIMGLVMFVMFSILQDRKKTKQLRFNKKKVSYVTLGVSIFIVIVLFGLIQTQAESYPFSFCVMFFIIFLGLSIVCFLCNITKFKYWEENVRYYYNLLVFFFYCFTVGLVIFLGLDFKSGWFYLPLIVGMLCRYLVHLKPLGHYKVLTFVAFFNVLASIILIWAEIQIDASVLERLVWVLVRTVSLVNFFSILHQSKEPQKFFI